MTQRVGRWSEINEIPEKKFLISGMDFRKPEYRREVFLRFYEYHLKYKSHPGGVYFAMPWIANKFKFNDEQKLWFAFINGCSQNIVTTWKIFQEFPDVHSLGVENIEDWWNKNHSKFKAGSGWDSDRKHHKIGRSGFPVAVASYKKQVDKYGSQQEMFNSLYKDDAHKNFETVWDFVRENFISFGRLSTFSYLEYLRIQNQPIECNNMFLHDIDGSKSHRNGLCKVLGRDDLDWWDHRETHNPNFPGYKKETIDWLIGEADLLLEDARKAIEHPDVNFFTLESALCTYKSWHRPNRRYPNVYMDMMYDRIRYAESEWGDQFDLFWQMRHDCLPKHLLLEENPGDPGVTPEKQNHYRHTGQVIMMDKEWECFRNNFNDLVEERNRAYTNNHRKEFRLTRGETSGSSETQTRNLNDFF